MDDMDTLQTARHARQGTTARNPETGFSLIELAIVLGVLGILLAMTVPRYRSFITAQRLHGSTENLAALVRVSRERAMATGVDQPLHFYENNSGSDFHVHVPSVGRTSPWNFPPQIHYATGSTLSMTMLKDGSVDTPGPIILRDESGHRDTMSVLSSGIVLLR